MNDNEKYLEVDPDAENGTPDATGELLRAIAETVEQAPDGYRYDVSITLDEVVTADE